MGGLLAFLLILIVIVVFVVISILGSILGGFLNLFGLRKNSGKTSGSNRNATTGTAQSKDGATRMRKFKNVAEDADYEIIEE
jgi:hypothetical protein